MGSTALHTWATFLGSTGLHTWATPGLRTVWVVLGLRTVWVALGYVLGLRTIWVALRYILGLRSWAWHTARRTWATYGMGRATFLGLALRYGVALHYVLGLGLGYVRYG